PPEPEWLWTWGYHHLFHGELTRADLDAVSRTRPIVVWHRSFHEVRLNTAALEALGLLGDDTRAALASTPQADVEAGRFYENGLAAVAPRLFPRLLAPRRYFGALAEARDVLHAGGITTVGDGAFGSLDLSRETLALRLSAWNRADTPFRTVLLADARALAARSSHEAVVELVRGFAARDTGRLRFRDDAVKLFADGAFFSQLMQLGPPGYLDGHEGEWLMEPAALRAAVRAYWRAGLQIHVHANGDAGVDAALDALEAAQRETPRDDHRFALHHFGYARPDQVERIARLGAVVSANPFYVWALADLYAREGLGPERAAELVRLGSLERAGVSVSLHSDFTMAPAQPLRLAQVAVTRRTAEGRVAGADEALSLEGAMRAITIGGARLLRMEDEIGSIAPGKRADFTVLAEDPYEVDPERLADIPIWGTVFEGVAHPLVAGDGDEHSAKCSAAPLGAAGYE
ncbi:MAG: amidohydrolase family protein, partial [Myxococcales bacterium]|nr:amidohydrolase family protein [Myxococcales bacterium]